MSGQYRSQGAARRDRGTRREIMKRLDTEAVVNVAPRQRRLTRLALRFTTETTRGVNLRQAPGECTPINTTILRTIHDTQY